MTETVPERIWVIDLDGTGSMHPSCRGDEGATEYVPATALEVAQARIVELEACYDDQKWKRYAAEMELAHTASARREALEEAAKVASDLSTKWWEEYKDRLNAHAGSTHHEGMSDGAEEVSAAIRALMEEPNENG